jgi:hypothetical protein
MKQKKYLFSGFYAEPEGYELSDNSNLSFTVYNGDLKEKKRFSKTKRYHPMNSRARLPDNGIYVPIRLNIRKSSRAKICQGREMSFGGWGDKVLLKRIKISGNIKVRMYNCDGKEVLIFNQS